jgi:hypothetical protein
MESFLRQDIEYMGAVLDLGDSPNAYFQRLIAFCIGNVTISSYQQFLMHLLIDFPGIIGLVYGSDDDDPGEYLRQILRGAADNTLFIHDSTRPKDIKRCQNVKTQSQKDPRAAQKWIAAQQPPRGFQPPVNIEKKPIPGPLPRPVEKSWEPTYFSMEMPGYRERMDQRIKELQLKRRTRSQPQPADRQGRTNPRAPAEDPEKRAERDLRQAQLHAYMLMNCLQQMLGENPDLLRTLQAPYREGEAGTLDRPSLTEYLLFIGTFADATSMVSAAAFRLIGVIAYGTGPVMQNAAGDDADLIEGIYTRPEYKDLVSSYASDFYFTQPPTPQMIAAFPIFWNHRYPNSIYENASTFAWPPVRIALLDTDGKPSREYWEHSREAGSATPLERFGHYIFFEPPVNQMFNNEVTRVLRWYQKEFEGTRFPDADTEKQDRASEERWFQYQRKVCEWDSVFFDFLRVKFNLQGPRLCNMGDIVKSLPLWPTDEFYTRERKEPSRALLNGSILDFAMFWQDSDFFSLAQDRSPMAEFAVEAPTGPSSLEVTLRKYADLAQGFRATTIAQPSDKPIEYSPPPPQLGAIVEVRKGPRLAGSLLSRQNTVERRYDEVGQD